MKAFKKLLLGETWLLPLGVLAIVAVAGLVLKPALGDAWKDAGGFVLAGALLVLVLVSTFRTRT
jgi:hypothetical protein